jgi:hypothetical protein
MLLLLLPLLANKTRTHIARPSTHTASMLNMLAALRMTCTSRLGYMLLWDIPQH